MSDTCVYASHQDWSTGDLKDPECHGLSSPLRAVITLNCNHNGVTVPALEHVELRDKGKLLLSFVIQNCGIAPDLCKLINK